MSPDWLPDGWTMEIKSRNGKNIKSYIHHRTGHRFYSKPKVLEYLRTVKTDDWTPQNETVESASYIDLPERTIGTAGSDPYGCITETPQENGFYSGKNCEIGASEILQSEKMDSEESADWLPAGWTEEIKVRNGRTVKNYVDPLWGHRFCSKPQVLDYLGSLTKKGCTASKETADVSSEINLSGKTNRTPKPLPHISELTIPVKNGSKSKSPLKIMDRTKALPDGWITETKPRKFGSRAGYPDKQYIDPVTGRKFNSKQKVFKYLGIVDPHNSISQQKKSVLDNASNLNVDKTEGVTPPPQLVESQNGKTPDGAFHSSTSKERSCRMRLRRKSNVDKIGDGTPPQVKSQNMAMLNHTGYSSISKEASSSEQPGKKIGMEQLSREGLPPGWIKEITKSADRKRNVSYFIDPVSGYAFTSMKDAWRYLEAGDISKCVKKPKKRVEMGFTTELSSFNSDKTEGVTPPPQLAESHNAKTVNITGHSSILRETSFSEQPERKIGGEQLSPEGLPPGWIKQTKTQKKANRRRNVSYFIDPASGYVFTSQKDAWRYYGTGDISKCVKKPKKREETRFATERNSPKMVKTDWKTALKQLEHSHPVNTPKRVSLSSPQKEMTSSKQSGIEIVVERVSPEGLPPGWIKEVRTIKRPYGIRKDKFYTDPISGYVLSSVKDVFRYVETGDLRYCTCRPRSRDQLGLDQGSSNASMAVMHKLYRDTTEEQVSTANNNGSKRKCETADTDFSPKRRQRRASSSDVTTNTPVVGLRKQPSRFSKRNINTEVIQKSGSTEQALTDEVGNLGENDNILRVNPPMQVENSGKNSQDQSFHQFGEETWSNPCLDYAFATLTGTLPFEDNAYQVSGSRDQSGYEAPVMSEPAKQSPTSPVFLSNMKTAEENMNNEKEKLNLDNYARFLF